MKEVDKYYTIDIHFRDGEWRESNLKEYQAPENNKYLIDYDDYNVLVGIGTIHFLDGDAKTARKLLYEAVAADIDKDIEYLKDKKAKLLEKLNG